MNLGEGLSNMQPKEKVCIKTQSGLVYNNNVENAKKVLHSYLLYEIKNIKVSFQPRKFRRSLIKLTTIYI